MAQRAADFSTAQNICLAVELARCGAGASLIEDMTGFGARWIRGIVLENGGAWARKPRNPLRWLEGDLQRLLHASYLVMAHERQPPKLPRGKQLLNAYRAYRMLAPPQGLLDINECGQIIELYQDGTAYLRTCTHCHTEYLVLADRPSCPVCRFVARTFCKNCDATLEPNAGKPRSYCPDCAPRAVRMALQRKDKHIELIDSQVGQPVMQPVKERPSITVRPNQVREPDIIATTCSAFSLS